MNNEKVVIIADTQDITHAGILWLLGKIGAPCKPVRVTEKSELTAQLESTPDAIVILDYALFDFRSIEDFMITCERFSKCYWLLFSDEFGIRFLRQTLFSPHRFGVIFKSCGSEEILLAVNSALENKEPYICKSAQNILATEYEKSTKDITLTSTEREILILIVQGRTTKEIATERFLSTHTVMTHRKNIFRKLDINTIHEATKYAFRIGLIDLAEYYI